MARHKLTEKQIKALTKPGIDSDGDGLYIRVRKGGSKNWVFIWKRNGKRTEYGLGGYGQGTAPVSLALARVKAHDFREDLARGIVPDQGERTVRAGIPKPSRNPDIFLAFIEDTIALKTASSENAKHINQWKTSLNEHAAPLHYMPIRDIEWTDVADAIRERWIATPTTAARTINRIAAVFEDARDKEKFSGQNPADMKGPLGRQLPQHAKKEKDHHKAVDFKKMPAVAARLRAENDVFNRCAEFIALTAVRAQEAQYAVFDEFDLEAGIWTIPAERMKKRITHHVPLSARAIAIVKERMEVATGDLVFQGIKDGTPVSQRALRHALRVASGSDEDTHGLRSTFSVWAYEVGGYSPELIDFALAHKVGGEVQRAYLRTTGLELRRPMMQAWSDYLSENNDL